MSELEDLEALIGEMDYEAAKSDQRVFAWLKSASSEQLGLRQSDRRAATSKAHGVAAALCRDEDSKRQNAKHFANIILWPIVVALAAGLVLILLGR